MIGGIAFRSLTARRFGTAWSRRSGYVDRAVFATATLGAAVAAWTAAGWSAPGHEPSAARAVAAGFLALEAGLAALIVPLSHLLSLASERRKASFDLLLLAPMTGFEQLLGRASGRLGALAAVLAAGLPGLFLLVPAGGLEAQEAVVVQLLVLGLAAAALGAASFFGALFHAFAPAVAATWATLAAWLGGPYLGEALAPAGARLWRVWKNLTPGGLLERELVTVRPDWGAAAEGLALGAALLLAGCAAGGLLLRPVHIRGRGRGEGEAALRSRARTWAASPRWGRFFRPLFPARSALARQACLMDRDRRFRLAWLVLAALAAGAGGLTALLPAGDSVEAQVLVVGIGLACAVVLTAVSAANALSSARRQGRLEALLAANVEPDDILRAGTAGRMVRGIYLALPSGLHGLILALGVWPADRWPAVLPAAAGVGLALATAAVLGQACSTLARRRAVPELLALVVVSPAACLVGGLAAASWLGLMVLSAVGLGALLGLHAWVAGRFRRWVLS